MLVVLVDGDGLGCLGLVLVGLVCLLDLGLVSLGVVCGIFDEFVGEVADGESDELECVFVCVFHSVDEKRGWA